jgi:hypothetical protein
MLRPQDILFGLLGLLIAALMALHFGVAVPALLGAFACGSIYVFAGMVPPREEPFLRRTFTTVFLSVVVSSLVLILPGTLGSQTVLHPEVKKAALIFAGLLPLIAIGFEVIRTPRVIRGILRCLGYR